jgi:hypothetical protein
MPERLLNSNHGWDNTTDAEEEIKLLGEMIRLLQGYERDCIAKLDLGSAKQTRERISRLNGKEEELRSKVARARQGQQVTQAQSRFWR